MARHGRVRDATSGRQARYQESTDTGATDLAAGPATSLVFEQPPCLRRKEDGTGGEKRLKPDLMPCAPSILNSTRWLTRQPCPAHGHCPAAPK